MKDIENWLNGRIGLNFRSGLERIKKAAALLGNPQTAYPVIHVTGTNGKGSTIAFMNSLFKNHGRKAGTFTSPHIVSIHDRICIAGQPISDEDFLRLGRQVQEMERELLQSHDQLSYFEILTLIALLYFKEKAVDLALIEVGIGGLLDTTNILTADIAIITSVGLDHQETLGNTIEEIAWQKAGIFKQHKQAVIGPLPNEAKLICQNRARDLQTELYQHGRDFSFFKGQFRNKEKSISHLNLGLAGAYQQENAALALQAFLLFMKEQAWIVEETLIRQALAETSWPGRLEECQPNIYLDGAHNLPALTRLAEFIRTQQDREISILFGALKRKDYRGMLAYLQKELPTASLTVTSFAYDQSLEKEDMGAFPYTEDYRQFIQHFQTNQKENQLLFVTGSLYFIAEVRAFLQGKS